MQLPATPRTGDPLVLLIGVKPFLTLQTDPYSGHESVRLDCHCRSTEKTVLRDIAQLQPDVLITIGNLDQYPIMHTLPFFLRKRWLHYPDISDLGQIGRDAWACFLHAALDLHKDPPALVSVFTPVYNGSPALLEAAYRSLCAQTYSEWEWVLFDDGSRDKEVVGKLRDLAYRDYRVRLVTTAHRGIIGACKRDAALLGTGSILLELDYDDTLRSDALAQVVTALADHPEVGFVFSDFLMKDALGSTEVSFGEHWAWGFGETRREPAGLVHGAPINAATIRHIVGAPNHLRAWRRSTYLHVGGHNPNLPIVDDYELVVRTFLHTRMLRLRDPLYTQLMGSTTTDARRKSIQRLTRHIAAHYDGDIHQRLVDLDMDDFLWHPKGYTDWGLLSTRAVPT